MWQVMFSSAWYEGRSDREGEEGEEETQRVRGGEGGSELSSAVVIWIQN